MTQIQVGASWDTIAQDERFRQAKELNLLDYVEVNYPIALNENPIELNLPILPHTSKNPLCSAYGIDIAVASRVKEGVEQSNYSWVGEHLAWLNLEASGSLGYVISPLFIKDFVKIAKDNIHYLQDYYGARIALELGPVYGKSGDYDSEMHFLSDVAEAADTFIIFDVTHWQISNLNLRRDPMYGLEALNPDRVVELHIAGMRSSSDGNYWHDDHSLSPSKESISLMQSLTPRFKSLKTITLEHAIDGNEGDFFRSLAAIKASLN